jgi:hypothetical protein
MRIVLGGVMRPAHFDAIAFLKVPLGSIPLNLVLPIFCTSIAETIAKWAWRYPQLYPIGRVWIEDAKRYAETM